jgi:hypothetical protein
VRLCWTSTRATDRRRSSEVIPSEAFDFHPDADGPTRVRSSQRARHGKAHAGAWTPSVADGPRHPSVVGPLLTDDWRLTAAATTRLLEDAFGAGAASVESAGTLLSQVTFLEGLAAQDLTSTALEASDVRFSLLVRGRSVKDR